MKVLLAPGTTGIAKEIFNSLFACKNIELYGCGFDLSKAKEMKYEKFFYVSESNSRGQVLESIATIVKNSGINAIFVCHDEWLREISISELHSYVSTKVVNFPTKESSHLLSKRETYKKMAGRIFTPTTYESVEEIAKYPLFLKPDRGQGSRGTKMIYAPSDLSDITISNGSIIRKENLLCEFLPGEEFTIDCFSNSAHKLLYSLARKRVLVSEGIASETHTVRLPEISAWLAEISESFKLSGAWFAQFKRSDEGNLKLLEVGIRVAGASGINRALGVNLALMSLHQFLGHPIEIINQYHYAIYWQKSNTVKIDYNFKNAFIDFDDTITHKSKINRKVVEGIKKWKELGIEISIITRSRVDISQQISDIGLKNCISAIIYVGEERKSSKITCSDNFVFVDDSFRERQDVHEVHRDRALVLDPSAFETDLLFAQY